MSAGVDVSDICVAIGRSVIEIQIVNPELKQQSLKLNYRTGYFAKTTNADPATRKRTGGDQ